MNYKIVKGYHLMNVRSHVSRFAVLLVVLSLGLTLVGGYFSHRYFRIESETRFQEWAVHVEGAIQNRIAAYTDVLQNTRALFGADERLGHEQLSAYVRQLDIRGRYPGLLGISFAPRVPRSQLAAHQARIRTEGFAKYSVFPRPAKGDTFPIAFVEPFDVDNRKAHGFDAYSDPVRRAAMETARDTGQPAATGPIQLPTDKPGSPAFQIFLPVYAKGAVLDTIDDRRKALIGFLSSPFRVSDLFREIFGANLEAYLPIDFTVQDGTASSPGGVLFSTHAISHAEARLEQQVPFIFAGHRWTLRFQSKEPTRMLALEHIVPGGIIALGLGITYLCIALLFANRRANRARTSAEEAQRAARDSEAEARGLARREELANLRYRELVDGLDNGIVWSADPHRRRFTFASAGAAKILGLPAGKIDIPFDRAFERATAEERVRLEQAFERAIAGHHVRIGHSFASDDEQTLWLDTSMHLSRAEGEREEIRGLSVDLTDLKHMEERLIAAVSVRDEFLSIASHELKTPLTPLRLQLQLAIRFLETGDAALIEDVKQNFKLSIRHVDRLARLIGNLLDVSRIQAGRLDLNHEEVDLSVLVRDTLDRFGPQLRDAHSNITTDLPASLKIFCDPMRIEQVVTNLVSNAIKYGEGEPIEIRLRRRDGGAQLEVVDSGPGIPLAKRDAIFERFERASADANVSGLGLGLYIVKQILNAHKGEIEVHSAPGGGTIFSVKLPCAGRPTYRLHDAETQLTIN